MLSAWKVHLEQPVHSIHARKQGPFLYAHNIKPLERNSIRSCGKLQSEKTLRSRPKKGINRITYLP